MGGKQGNLRNWKQIKIYCRVQLVEMALVDFLDQTDQKVSRARQVLLVNKELLERLVTRESKDQKESLVWMAVMVKRGLLVKKGKRYCSIAIKSHETQYTILDIKLSLSYRHK